jgi:hypothetical protein
VDTCSDIAQLVGEIARAMGDHPVAAAILTAILVVLRYVVGQAGSATISYFWTEHVLKRLFPPPPSPTEEALRKQVERLSRKLGRAEGGRDAARDQLGRERRRAERLEAQLRRALNGRRRRRSRRRRRGRRW